MAAFEEEEGNRPPHTKLLWELFSHPLIKEENENVSARGGLKERERESCQSMTYRPPPPSLLRLVCAHDDGREGLSLSLSLCAALSVISLFKLSSLSSCLFIFRRREEEASHSLTFSVSQSVSCYFLVAHTHETRWRLLNGPFTTMRPQK